LVSIFGMCVASQIITLQHTLKQQSRKDSTKQTREDSTCLPQVLCEIAYCCVVLVKNNWDSNSKIFLRRIIRTPLWISALLLIGSLIRYSVCWWLGCYVMLVFNVESKQGWTRRGWTHFSSTSCGQPSNSHVIACCSTFDVEEQLC